MKDHCRNNVGNWPTREVAAPRGARGFDYYSLKDRAMAEAAEYGLMLWDGKSKGTVNNVVNLSRTSDENDGWMAHFVRVIARARTSVAPICASTSATRLSVLPVSHKSSTSRTRRPWTASVPA